MESLLDRIAQIAESEGIKIVALERAIGASKGVLSRAINNRTDIQAKWVQMVVENYPRYSERWLLTGEGEMLKRNFETKSTEILTLSKGKEKGKEIGNKPKVQNSLPNETPYTDHTPIAIVRDSVGIKSLYKDTQERIAEAQLAADGIPLIPLDAVAGFCNGDVAQVMEFECEKYVIPSFRGAEFLIPVKGSSMYPKYSSGDIVACKCLPLDTFFQWNKVYVVDTEQGVLIKRVRRGPDDDHILLVSENERYEPFLLHKSAIHALAIVIGVIRLE